MRTTARKLFRVVPEAFQGFYADHCPLQAAGIAYRVLFSVVPLAIVLVSIFGLILQDDAIRHSVVNSIVDFLPVSAAGRKDVEKALTSIATPASAAAASFAACAFISSDASGAVPTSPAYWPNPSVGYVARATSG